MGAQLTFKSVRDEFNREHDGSATGNRLGIQIDLRGRVKKKKREERVQTWGRRMKGRGDRGGGVREE